MRGEISRGAGVEIVTLAMIESRRSRRGGFTKKDLAWLGVAYPPSKGWKWEIMGKPRRPVEYVTPDYKRTKAISQEQWEKVRRLFNLAMAEARRRGYDLQETEVKVVRKLAERFGVRKCAVRRVTRTRRRRGRP